MEVKKVLTVFGTRPEAIKMAPVALAIADSQYLHGEVCVTAQHRGMLDQVMDIFGLHADFDLDLMQSGQDLYDLTSRVILGMRAVLQESRPDMVLVHGDTTTCFAAALACYYAAIPLGHVEAGLRTGDKYAPFPEELNRSMVGRLADIHFAPTIGARDNLMAENVPLSQVAVTGNTVIDALKMAKDMAAEMSMSHLAEALGAGCYEDLRSSGSRVILITGHRRENFGKGFSDLCAAIRSLAETHSDWVFVYPVHLNPNVQAPVNQLLEGVENIHLIAPQDYLPFVWLMDNCDLILTDSGGIQEEGPALGKPVLVMRDRTERPEAVAAGTVKLVGTNPQRIIDGVEEVLSNEEVYKTMSSAISPYGDGQAANRIVEAILAFDSDEIRNGKG